MSPVTINELEGKKGITSELGTALESLNLVLLFRAQNLGMYDLHTEASNDLFML
jgi:hypothetical protein